MTMELLEKLAKSSNELLLRFSPTIMLTWGKGRAGTAPFINLHIQIQA